MRLVVALVLIAAVGGVGYLVLVEGEDNGSRSQERGESPDRENGGAPDDPPPTDPLPDIAKIARDNPSGPTTQKELAAFVAECKRRGAEAVPLLLRLLASGEDKKLLPRWHFREGKLAGFPTLRSAYLIALRSIPGEESTFAMRELMKELREAGESYLIASELQARGVQGWSEDLLRTAVKSATPAGLDLRREMVRLAATNEPEGMARVLTRDIPRGESKEDGRLLSDSLRDLPMRVAIDTAAPLMMDDQVTYRAKGHIIRAMLNRSEPDVFRAMHQEVLRGGLDEKMRIAVAYAAANSQSFFLDAAAMSVARAQQDTSRTDAIQREFDERMRAAEELISAALEVDLANTTDMRASAMRRTLQAHRKKLEGK